MNEGTQAESAAFTPPLFVLFGDGTLWAYSAMSDVSLTTNVGVEDLRAWDGVGRDLKLTRPEAATTRVCVHAVGTSSRGDLQAVVADRLRNANVRNVENLSFEDMVDKASIRFVAPKPADAAVGVIGAILEALAQLLQGPRR